MIRPRTESDPPDHESHPVLPPEVVIQPGTDELAELARRFRPFEALHDGLDIGVPVTPTDLDKTVALLAPQPTDVALDVACGAGAILIRLAERTPHTSGIDLSPWALAAAHRHLASRSATLILGDAARLPSERAFDIIACIGASWIFHGFSGTARALARRLRPGGRIAIGDVRLRPGATPPSGALPDGARQAAAFDEAGLEIIGTVVSDAGAWNSYAEAVTAAAQRHHATHRDDPAADQRSVARRWVADMHRDRAFSDFAIVVGRRRHRAG